jgi:hypothetical protein
VFRDDVSLLAKLDPGAWPKRHGDIESRASHDEVTQTREHFLPCRFDPHDLEAQLAILSYPE